MGLVSKGSPQVELQRGAASVHHSGKVWWLGWNTSSSCIPNTLYRTKQHSHGAQICGGEKQSVFGSLEQANPNSA